MSLTPDPVWPVLVLAVIQVVDALLCLGPVAPIAKCFEDVHFPRSWWWIFPVIKLSAAAGLIAGLWVPGLGLLTGVALVVYFLMAIAMHLRARDLGRNLFVNAAGMLLICGTVTTICFLT